MHVVASHVSYDHYLALADTTDELLEYHDGVVVAMVAPSYAHARILSKLTAELAISLRDSGKPTCVALTTGLRVRVEKTNRTLIPDLTVLCGAAEHSDADQEAITNPVVVFEVLSPSTENYDQNGKLHQYRRLASLREYVVIAQDRRFASICRRVGDLWAFEDVEANGVLKLESLGFGIAFDDLYVDAVGVIVESRAVD